MEKVSIIGLDLAKRSFQAHGALSDGGVGSAKSFPERKFSASLPSSRAASSPWKPVGARTTGGEPSGTSGMRFD
jgi:hypothetical protein